MAGISAGLLCALISEVGTREQLLEAFPTPERFASWMGLFPYNRISGGKVLKAKTRKVKSRLEEAFKTTPQSEARRRKALEKQAAALGLTLQPAASPIKLVGQFKNQHLEIINHQPNGGQGAGDGLMAR